MHTSWDPRAQRGPCCPLRGAYLHRRNIRTPQRGRGLSSKAMWVRRPRYWSGGDPSPLGHPCPHRDDVGLNQMSPKLCRSCSPLLE